MSGFVLVGLLLGLLAVLFVLQPIIWSRPPAGEHSTAAQELHERRQAIYRQIVDIEFDQRTGKMAEADAQELSVALLSEAAELLATQANADRGADAAIEREIAAVRRALVASRADELETSVR